MAATTCGDPDAPKWPQRGNREPSESPSLRHANARSISVAGEPADFWWRVRVVAFDTPSRVVRVLVAMLAPYKGRVYDPCCGSGGMFVSSEKFIEAHSGKDRFRRLLPPTSRMR